jgi:hypothetical protein
MTRPGPYGTAPPPLRPALRPDQPFGVLDAVEVAAASVAAADGVAVPGAVVRVEGAAGLVGATGDFFG